MQLDINYEDSHEPVKAWLRKRFVEDALKLITENPSVDDNKVLDTVRLDISKELAFLNYEIVIPVSEIQSVNFFDIEIYREFFASETEEKAT